MQFVIFASPQRFDGPNRCIAKDGTVTDLKGKMATFSTSKAAEDFAGQNHIALDGVTRYIGQMDFSGDLGED